MRGDARGRCARDGDSRALLPIPAQRRCRPLEPVLEHNRLDLVSLAAVTARALQLVDEGKTSCRDAAEVLSLGRSTSGPTASIARRTAIGTPRSIPPRMSTCGRRPSTGSASGCAATGASRTPRSSWRELLDLRPAPGPTDADLHVAPAVRRGSARHPSRAPRAGLRSRTRPCAVGAERCRWRGGRAPPQTERRELEEYEPQRGRASETDRATREKARQKIRQPPVRWLFVALRRRNGVVLARSDRLIWRPPASSSDG